MTTLTDLKQCLISAHIPPADMDVFMLMSADLSEESLTSWVKMVCEKPDLVKQINATIQRKRAALSTGNVEDWTEIVKVEKSLIDEMSVEKK